MTDVIVSGRCGRELLNLHPAMRRVLLDVVAFWPTNELVITSIYRDREEDGDLGGSGVHATSPHRAVDIRIRNLSEDPQRAQEGADAIAQIINTAWDYDPSRPGRFKVAVSKMHGSGPHIHLQVHPKTEKIRALAA